MENKKIIAIVAIIVVIGLIIALVPNQSNGLFASNEDTITIGVIGGFTGVGAYYAQQEQRGVDLAVEQINQNGGIDGKQIVLVYEDSEIKEAKAITAFQKLTELDNVKFIIGDSWNGTSAAMEPFATQKKVILISPVTILTSLSKDDYFFRTVPTIKGMMYELAEHSFDNDSRKVGIIRNKLNFSAEHAIYFKERFIQLGGVIVSEEIIEIDQVDARTELTRIKQYNPDTIFNLHTSGPLLGILAKQVKELGIEVKLISTFSTENHELARDYADVIEGTTFPYTFDKDSELESVRTFVANYEAKYNELPDFTAANSYDSMNLLALAINKVGQDPAKVKEFFLSVKDYEGGSGLITFDENGDAIREIIIKQAINGEFVRVD